MATEEHNEIFSDDPEEQLRIENQILRLKLRAELGSNLNGLPDIPPEIENFFLRHVLSFAHMQDTAEKVTLHQFLGAPEFKKVETLTAKQIPKALKQIEKLMTDNNVLVSYEREYPAKEKYRFITEDLFVQNILNIHEPDMTLHFVYEEYYPDLEQHAYDIVEYFLSRWMEGDLEGVLLNLSPVITAPDGRSYSEVVVVQRLATMFEAFVSFSDVTYEIHVEQGKDTDTAGLVTGHVRYTAMMEDGDTMLVEGPLRFHLRFERGRGWLIAFFEWPGFSID